MFGKKMTKKQVIKKIEKAMKTAAADLVKEIQSILKDGDVWYSQTEEIKLHEELHQAKDHNGDQLLVDFLPDVISQAYGPVTNLREEDLWTSEEISK